MQIPSTHTGTLYAAMQLAIETWTEDEAAMRDVGQHRLADQFALQIKQARELRDGAEAGEPA